MILLCIVLPKIWRPTSLGHEETTKQKIWRIRPTRTSAKNWRRTTREGTKAAAAFALNGQRVGELPESFWTAAGRWITRLASGLRSQVQGHKAPARSTESA